MRREERAINLELARSVASADRTRFRGYSHQQHSLSEQGAGAQCCYMGYGLMLGSGEEREERVGAGDFSLGLEFWSLL